MIAAGLGYFLQNYIMAAIMRPLGGQRLVYLTPIGGFNFLFKVSLYFGIGLILPVIVYHLYRFLEPIMDYRLKRSVGFYSVASLLLASGGACFAYFGSLPAALHFLTGFSIQNVSAMLTADSYLSFVITYVLGFAVLFQIPLILMIINTITPIPPKKLFGFQRFVVLAAFIIAAVISPTPDITNQAILAVPIIVMYQIGVLIVWTQSRRLRRRASPDSTAQAAPQPVLRRAQPATIPIPSSPTPTRAATPRRITTVRPVMDIATSATRRTTSFSSPVRTATRQPVRSSQRVQPRPLARSTSSIDGFVVRSQRAPQAS